MSALQVPLGFPDRTQRWRLGRDEYRRRGEAFRPGDFGVEPLPDFGRARAFVEAHHYSGSWVAARCVVGLYRRVPAGTPELVGVAAFSVGVQPRAVPAWAPGTDPADGVDLGRFVLLDDVPYNAETFFLARCFPILRAEAPNVRVVLSYSDPVAISDDEGRVVTPGHVGAIYQAKGARYVGRTAPDTKHLDAKGRTVARRSLSKIALGETGWESAARRFVDRGAPDRVPGEEPGAWVQRALREGPFRPLRHPGQHVYLFAADGKGATAPGGREALPYPKKRDDPPLTP